MALTPEYLRELKKIFKKIDESQILATREFYEAGLTAEFTAEQSTTPMRDTTQRLFRLWNMELLDKHESKISDRQILALEKFKLSGQRMLVRLNSTMNMIDNTVEDHYKKYQIYVDEQQKNAKADQIKEYRPLLGMENLRLRVIALITRIHNMIAGAEAMPVAYELQEERILENLQARTSKMVEENLIVKPSRKSKKVVRRNSKNRK